MTPLMFAACCFVGAIAPAVLILLVDVVADHVRTRGGITPRVTCTQGISHQEVMRAVRTARERCEKTVVLDIPTYGWGLDSEEVMWNVNMEPEERPVSDDRPTARAGRV